MIVYFLLIEEVISMETNMNEALLASWERFHFKSKILDPIFSIGTASPWNNDNFRNRFVADVSSSESQVIVYMSNIY